MLIAHIPAAFLIPCYSISASTTGLPPVLFHFRYALINPSNAPSITASTLPVSKPVLWYTCLRLVLYPLLLCVLLKPLHLDTTLTNVCILMTGMPAGSTGSILADKYDCDAVFASQIAFASTLCSILTIPLLTLVMESFPL